jgi:diacylglycerol kinase family enzyme
MALLGEQPLAHAASRRPEPSGGEIGVVVNPYAGGNRDERRRAEAIRREVGDLGGVYETGSLAEIDDVARELHQKRIRMLAICGGDGSFFRTLSALVRVYGDTPLPHFLPLRAGSMNTIARAVGCRAGSPEAVLAAVIAEHRDGRPADIATHHLIRVNGGNYGFLVGAGVIVNFLRAYYERPERGPLPAARLLGRIAVGGLYRSAEVRRLFDTTDAAIDCDGDRVSNGACRIIFASTVPQMGLGFRLAYRAGPGIEGFHFLAGNLSPAEVLVRLPRVHRGRPLNLPGWHDALAQRVAVEFTRPTHYMIDGDILEQVVRLEMSTGPRLAIIR